jgi:hypothetical protein
MAGGTDVLNLVDPTFQMLPWQSEVARAYGHHRLPLWNADSGSGAPLLANDPAAAFSPFTLLAVPFGAARGLSLVMLLKIWVAGAGLYLWVRLLSGSRWASVFAGAVFATSSGTIVWLAYPLGSVACIAPVVFASVELLFRRRDRWGLAALSVSTAALLVAGHLGTASQFLLCVALYCGVRIAPHQGRTRLAGATLAALALGIALASAQVLPVAVHLLDGGVVGGRAGLGLVHLTASDLLSWVAPNRHGSPAIEGVNDNYMSTGYIGVGALTLAIIGAVCSVRERHNAGLALTAMALFAAFVAYGAMTPLVGRLPLVSVAQNSRFVVVAALPLSALAGLGLDRVANWRGRGAHRVLSVVGIAALGGLLGAAVLLVILSAGVDRLVPNLHHFLGFWMLFSALGAVASMAWIASARLGGARLAVIGMTILAVTEGMTFALPFNAQTARQRVPPPSRVMAWLANHPGDVVAAAGAVMPANSASLYGLRDVRIRPLERQQSSSALLEPVRRELG